jgi:hypothetical protein
MPDGTPIVRRGHIQIAVEDTRNRGDVIAVE